MGFLVVTVGSVVGSGDFSSDASVSSSLQACVLQLLKPFGRSEYRQLSDSFNKAAFMSGSKHFTVRRCVPLPQLRVH